MSIYGESHKRRPRGARPKGMKWNNTQGWIPDPAQLYDAYPTAYQRKQQETERDAKKQRELEEEKRREEEQKEDRRRKLKEEEDAKERSLLETEAKRKREWETKSASERIGWQHWCNLKRNGQQLTYTLSFLDNDGKQHDRGPASDCFHLSATKQTKKQKINTDNVNAESLKSICTINVSAKMLRSHIQQIQQNKATPLLLVASKCKHLSDATTETAKIDTPKTRKHFEKQPHVATPWKDTHASKRLLLHCNQFKK